MKAIQQRYKNDRQRQSEELMKFYRENKINPYASCLPIVFQIPIFFALFFVLRDFEDEVFSVYGGELHWLGFVPDITAGITDHWSGYLLLIVYLGSQLTSTWLMSTAMQSTAQRVVIMALPLVFIPFILDPPGSTVFPVGLLIYWLTTNLWTTGQGIVTRRQMPRPVGPPPKRSSRTPPRGASAEPALAAEAGGGGSGNATPSRTGPPRRVKRKKGGRKR
jgi:YidC/Oxa1 family membrane protein insertase